MGTITIDRLQATYVVPPDDLRPDQTRARLDAVLDGRLNDACARRFGLLDGDEGVWLIRDVRVDVPLDGVDSDQWVVDTLAEHMARALTAAMREGPDGQGVLYFPTRAAFLARLCADLADGRLWERWYATVLDGLRSLPTSAAVASLVCREPEHVEETMLVLGALGRLERLLDVLTEPDAAAILDAWEMPGSATPHALAAVASWTATLRESMLVPTGTATLRVVAGMRAAKPEVPAAEARAAAELVLTAAETIVRAGGGAIEDLRAGRLATVARTLGGSPSVARLPALSAALAVGDEWLRPMASRNGSGHASPPALTSDRIATRFGGAVLLLPALAEVSERAFASIPAEERGLARLGLLASCFGHAQRDAAEVDAVVRLLTGAPRDRRLDEWLSSIGDAAAAELVHACVEVAADADTRAKPSSGAPELSEADLAFLAGDDASPHLRSLATAARCVLDGFARRLLGFRQSSAAYLVRNFLHVGASLAVDDDRIEARVAEPPLALVLRMAGIDGASFRVPWDDREVTVWLGAS